jgi:hypothetical protein
MTGPASIGVGTSAVEENMERVPVRGRAILFRTIKLTGTVSPAPSGLVVNGTAVSVTGGSWAATAALPEDGNSVITIHDSDPNIELPPTTIQVEVHNAPIGGG